MFLSSRELVRWSGENGSDPSPCWVVAKSYLQWPRSSSQMLAGRDPTTARFEGGQEVHPIPTKVVFACEKPLVVTLRWARR